MVEIVQKKQTWFQWRKIKKKRRQYGSIIVVLKWCSMQRVAITHRHNISSTHSILMQSIFKLETQNAPDILNHAKRFSDEIINIHDILANSNSIASVGWTSNEELILQKQSNFCRHHWNHLDKKRIRLNWSRILNA